MQASKRRGVWLLFILDLGTRELDENCHCRTDFSFILQIIEVLEITRFICMSLSSLGLNFKLKLKIL
jgi:hypothetical protein